jgi:DNA invertase Pin-like site-specific DNA recombinase
MEPSKRTAFGYLRVSGHGQVDGDGFPRQKLAIEKFAAANGIKIKRFFEERGVSGAKDLDHRPALLDMMTELHSNGTKLVVIEKLDRLARDLMIQESIIADFRRQGFELVSTCEPDLCVDDPSRKLMRQMLGAFAEYEKAMIVIKLRGARQRQKARSGKCEGRCCFGPHSHPARQRDEAMTLDRMIKLRGKGSFPAEIARTLNAEGRATRLGKSWHPDVVARVLAREGRR